MRRYSPYRISTVVLLVGCVPLFVTAAHELVAQDWGQPNALAFGALQAVGGLVIGAGIVLSRLAQPPAANID